MKKKLTPLAFILLLSGSLFAQVPQKMSYQAVIRNASNILVTEQSVGMRISILQGSATGTAVYIETQTATTNTNGLLSIEIGEGTAVSGTFATIDWADGPYFIKTETDPAGGTTYTITATGQLLSVPYALLAEKVVTPTYPISVSDASTTFLSQTARNLWLSDPDISVTVPETGKYLLIFNSNHFANNNYFGYETSYDSDGQVRVYNTTAQTKLVDAFSVRSFIDLYSPNDAMRRYTSISPSRSIVVNLTAGDVLELQYILTGFGDPLPTKLWYIGNGSLSIIKIGN